MKTFSCLVLLACFVQIAFANSDYHAEIHEYNCPHHDCNGNGFCVSETECRCEIGYYGTECENGIRQKIPVAVETFRGIWSVGFFLASIVSVGGLVLAIKKNQDNSGPSSRIRTAVFGTISGITVTEFFVMAIDPIGQHNMMPDYIYKMLVGVDQPLAVIAFMGVLLHWFELVQMSKRKLRHESMLQQINANYPGKTITVEEMIESVKFLNRFRVPFLLLSIWTFVFSVLCDLFTDIHILPLTFNCLQQVYFVLIWIGMTIGFFYIRKQLVDLMPYQLSSQVRKLTFRVAVLCCCNLGIFITFSTLEVTATPKTAGATLAMFMIQRTIVILNCVMTCTTFLHIKKGFPFFTVSASSSFGTKSKSKSSGTKGTNSNFSSNVEMSSVTSVPSADKTSV